jgi:phosphate-selective porin
VTGEHFALKQGALLPIHPDRYFNPEDGTWGALVVAVRYDHFQGDKEWINPEAQVSVEQADAISLALNWVLFPMVRVIGDVTHTTFSDEIRVRVQPDGTVDTIDEENVFTLRLCMDF